MLYSHEWELGCRVLGVYETEVEANREAKAFRDSMYDAWVVPEGEEDSQGYNA